MKALVPWLPWIFGFGIILVVVILITNLFGSFNSANNNGQVNPGQGFFGWLFAQPWSF